MEREGNVQDCYCLKERYAKCWKVRKKDSCWIRMCEKAVKSMVKTRKHTKMVCYPISVLFFNSPPSFSNLTQGSSRMCHVSLACMRMMQALHPRPRTFQSQTPKGSVLPWKGGRLSVYHVLCLKKKLRDISISCHLFFFNCFFFFWNFVRKLSYFRIVLDL